MPSVIGQDSTASGFDPGLASPPMTFGVWGDSGNGTGLVGSSSRTPPADAPEAPGGAGVHGINHARGGMGVRGQADDADGVGVLGTSAQGNGVSGLSEGRGTGVRGTSAQGVGVFGEGGGFGVAGGSAEGTGVLGYSDGVAPGVTGKSAQGAGVLGTSDKGAGVGVFGVAQGTGVLGRTFGSGFGVSGLSAEGTGVWGNCTDGNSPGVAGNCNGNGTGVEGHSAQGDGVRGFSNETGTGIFGQNSGNGVGVYGVSEDGVGVQAKGGAIGIRASGESLAGDFQGNVRVSGVLTKGGGGFKIDHPLDQANRYLTHSFVESPEMKNLYDGVASLDADGQVIVELPDWFEALNETFRYQLTPIGRPAPGLHISRTLTGNRFSIAGGEPRMDVCWQVTGVRRDAWARANPLAVEEDKAPAEQGRYLHPQVHGQPAERGIAWLESSAPQPLPA
jgi:hypothetical protein